MLQHVTQSTTISHGCPINYNLCVRHKLVFIIIIIIIIIIITIIIIDYIY